MNPVRNSKTSSDMLSTVRSSSVAHSTERDISNGMDRRNFLKTVGLGAASQ